MKNLADLDDLCKQMAWVYTVRTSPKMRISKEEKVWKIISHLFSTEIQSRSVIQRFKRRGVNKVARF